MNKLHFFRQKIPLSLKFLAGLNAPPPLPTMIFNLLTLLPLIDLPEPSILLEDECLDEEYGSL